MSCRAREKSCRRLISASNGSGAEGKNCPRCYRENRPGLHRRRAQRLALIAAERAMARKYLRITEVIKICGVDAEFVDYLERERVVEPTMRRKLKYYSPDQVDRVRVAHLLMAEMGVNLEGAEIALHMREQMIAMQRQFIELLRLLGRNLKK